MDAPLIELRDLQCFVTVTEELNFRRAAERIDVDRTPFSRAAPDLEARLGVLLFMHVPRALRLTPACARLLKEAHKFSRTRRIVRNTDARHRASLGIGVADGISHSSLSECLAGWKALAPETPLELSEMSAGEPAAALRREELDAGTSLVSRKTKPSVRSQHGAIG